METLSPFTRRVVALGLLFLVVVSLINLMLVPGWEVFRASLGWLGDARVRRIQAETIAARPPPSVGAMVSRPLYIGASTRDTATQILAAQIRADAGAAGVTLSRADVAPPDPRAPGQAGVMIAAEGKELAIVGLIEGIEQEKPLMRLVDWRIERAPNMKGMIRFDARVIAAWSPS